MNFEIVLTAVVSSLATAGVILVAGGWFLRRRLIKALADVEGRGRLRLNAATDQWQRQFDVATGRLKGDLGQLSLQGESAHENDQREKQNMLAAMKGLTTAILRLESRVRSIERRGP